MRVPSGYGDVALDAGAERILGWARTGDVHCHFDNDGHGHAPLDVVRLLARLTD